MLPVWLVDDVFDATDGGSDELENPVDELAAVEEADVVSAGADEVPIAVGCE